MDREEKFKPITINTVLMILRNQSNQSNQFHGLFDSLSVNLIFSDERKLTVARETIMVLDP